jgi:hypothetical protein
MRPIPLSHEGVVYAYACGKCFRVPPAGMEMICSVNPADHVARICDTAERHRREAEYCCMCYDCKKEKFHSELVLNRCDDCFKKHMAIVRDSELEFAEKLLELDKRFKEALERAGTTEEKAYDLYRKMAEMSESQYAAGWCVGFEFDLWEQIQTKSDRPFNAHDVAEIITLYNECSGWWVHDDHFKDQVFLSLREWKELYDRRAIRGELS